MARIEGVIAKHAIIAAECRAGRGEMGAFEAAVGQLRREYEELLPVWAGTTARFHLVLTVERPEEGS